MVFYFCVYLKPPYCFIPLPKVILGDFILASFISAFLFHPSRGRHERQRVWLIQSNTRGCGMLAARQPRSILRTESSEHAPSFFPHTGRLRKISLGNFFMENLYGKSFQIVFCFSSPNHALASEVEAIFKFILTFPFPRMRTSLRELSIYLCSRRDGAYGYFASLHALVESVAGCN